MTITKRLWLATALTALSILLRSGLELSSVNSLTDLDHSLQRAGAAISSSTSVINSLEIAESNQRGYLLTGRQSYLTNFGGVKFNAMQSIAELKQSVPPKYLDEIEMLRVLAQKKFEELDQTISLKEIGQSDKALAVVLTDRGKVYMDQAQSLQTTFSQKLGADLSRQKIDTEHKRALLQEIILLSGPAIVLLLIVTIALALRSLKRNVHLLENRMAAIGESDDPQPCEVIKGELSVLARAFNHMVERVRNVAAERSSVEQQLIESNQRLHERGRIMQLLQQASERLAACTDDAEFSSVIQRFASRIDPSLSGCLYALASSGNILTILTSWNAPKGSSDVLSPDQCWGARRGQPHYIDNTGNDVLCAHIPSQLVTSYGCIPLIAQSETLGVLYVETSQNLPISKSVWATLLIFSETLSMALGNLRLRQKLKNQSIRDPLTGLYNRRFMEEAMDMELARASRASTPLSAIMLDVDHFKRFNDEFGHDAGDAVLIQVSETFSQHARKGDIVCRYGGEEFVILFPGMTREEVTKRVNHLLAAIREISISITGKKLGKITISDGVAVFPDSGITAAQLIKAADSALYTSKQAGRDRFTFATEELQFTAKG